MLLDEFNPDVVAISEAELDEKDASFYMPGYKAYYSSPFQQKIRVVLLLKNSLIRASTPTVLAASHQDVWIRVACPSGSGSWTFAACYRQWTRTESEDFVQLCHHIREFSSSSPRVVLLGDLNLDVARRDDAGYYRRHMLGMFFSLLSELGFVLHNDLNTPTFKSHGSFQTALGLRHRESVLDLICSLGTLDQCPVVRVLANAAGDHRPVLAAYPLHGAKAAVKVKYCRDFNKVTPQALLMAVNVAKISGVFQESDVDKIMTIIVQELIAALDLIAPLRPTFIKERTVPLSLARETRRTMAARDAAARRRDWPLYKRLRNLAARQVRQDRMSTTLDLLTRHKNDPKQVWKLADSLTGRERTSTLPPALLRDGQLVKGDEKLADIMNDFYISKIDKIRRQIDLEKQQQHGQQEQQRQHQQWQQERQQRRGLPPPPSSSSSPSSPYSSSSSPSPSPSSSSAPSPTFSLRAPTAWEVGKAINGLRNTPAKGEDGIPTSVIKDLAQVLAAPLAHLMDRSFASGQVPSAFKIANVIPILKPGKDPSLPSSFRPVALLSTLSKVMESIVMSQLSPFMARRLPAEQWGFRPARSTAGALAAAHGSWCRARTQGKTLGIAAFDFSSAFDTLGVEELVQKLPGLGIGEEAVNWIRNYLSNRRQRVRYGSASSSLKDVSYGVPQGSLLGPLLFIALTADLPGTLTDNGGNGNIGITLYADDTCVWCAHKDPGVVKEELELASSRLLKYALENSLALNPAKTQLLWTSNPSSINIGGTVVDPQDELLLLGITFDRKLSIRPHLQSLVGSARSLLALTRRLLLHLPRGRQVQDEVRALVVGRLCYGSILFPPRLTAEDKACQLLQQVQVTVNDMARLLLGVSRADKMPVEELVARSGLPAINRVVIKTILCEAWKCLRSHDNPDGGMNPLGRILSGPPNASTQRSTRAANAGEIPPPLRVRDETFIWFAFKLLNEHDSVRSAASYAAACRAAESISSAVPT